MTKRNKFSTFRIIEILMLIFVVHLVENMHVTNNTSIGVIDNRVNRYRKASNVPTHGCSLNQYFDKEEGRCRGVPGGGKVLHINTMKSCGIHTLKSHCSNPKYYYICKGNTTIIAECADGQHFEELLHRCVYADQRNLRPNRIRPDQEIFDHVQLLDCEKYGRFPVAGHCGLFYSCETNGHRWYQKVFKCPEKTEYDDQLKSCRFSWTCNDTMTRVSSICLSDVDEKETRLIENDGETVLENPRSNVEEATVSDSAVETTTTFPDLSTSTIEKPILSDAHDVVKSDESPLGEVEELADEENYASTPEPLPSDSAIESEKSADSTEFTSCNGQYVSANESCDETTFTHVPETETAYATQDDDDVAKRNADLVEKLDIPTTEPPYPDATESTNASSVGNPETIADDLALSNNTESANSLGTESTADPSEVSATNFATDEVNEETSDFTPMPNDEGQSDATGPTFLTSDEKESTFNPEYQSTPIPYSRASGDTLAPSRNETNALDRTQATSPASVTRSPIYPQTVVSTHDRSPVERIIANISERIERRVRNIIGRMSKRHGTPRMIE